MDFSQAKILWSMCAFEALRFRAYPHEMFGSIFARVAEVTLYCTFWLIVAGLSQNQNIQPVDIISYYLIISGVTPFLFAGFGIGAMMSELIKTGQLNQTLIRPISPILHPWAIRVGRNTLNMAFGVLQIIAGLIMVGGIRAEAWPFLLPVLFNALAINMALNIFIGTAAFYLQEGRGFKNTALHLSSFARGEKIPLHFMTPELASFLLLTPFPASQYHLAIVLQGVRLPAWSDVLIGVAWSIALLFLAVKFWRRGLRHYEAVGI